LWEQISKQEILGLFDYYLRDLWKNDKIAAYINDREKGFEKLQMLLDMVAEAGNK
jgi:hypothetical protein